MDWREVTYETCVIVVVLALCALVNIIIHIWL